jgi:hypothetical protein
LAAMSAATCSTAAFNAGRSAYTSVTRPMALASCALIVLAVRASSRAMPAAIQGVISKRANAHTVCMSRKIDYRP